MKKSAPFPKGSVCKPCWELKYCPYGAAVDYFPHATPGGSTTYLQGNERHSELLEEIRQLTSITPESIHDYSRLFSLTDPENRAYVARYYEAVACEATGHACPVFFLQSGATETREPRRESRHIPRAVMLQVVRRDKQKRPNDCIAPSETKCTALLDLKLGANLSMATTNLSKQPIAQWSPSTSRASLKHCKRRIFQRKCSNALLVRPWLNLSVGADCAS